MTKFDYVRHDVSSKQFVRWTFLIRFVLVRSFARTQLQTAHRREIVVNQLGLKKEESAMKNYKPPEAVEIGQASGAILGTKTCCLGDDILGPDYPFIEDSVIDSDD